MNTGSASLAIGLCSWAPACAGTTGERHPRAGEEPRTPPSLILLGLCSWVPACAGMTHRERRERCHSRRAAKRRGRGTQNPASAAPAFLGPLPLRRLSPPPAGDDTSREART